MIIGLNGQNLLTEKPAGPERYAINLYKSLAKLDRENSYRVYVDRPVTQNSELYELIKAPNFKFIMLKKHISWTHVGLELELLTKHVDIFFTPFHTVPFLKPRNTKYVAMIHGLEYKTNKVYSAFSIKGLIHPFVLWYVLNISNRIIVPSQFTKSQVLASKLLTDKEKLEVIYEGISSEFYPRDNSEIKTMRDKYELENKKYALCISTIQPRKNMPMLIEAYSKVLSENPVLNDTLLVFSGKKGWNYNKTLEAPKKFGVEKNVKFLNWVSQRDLPSLLSGASLYVNISIEEGFGLTVLEAMASGVRVIVSDIPAHREIGANFCIYVDPHNLNDIKSTLAKELHRKVEETNLNEVQKYVKNNFSWEKTATETLRLFKSIA